MAFTCIKLVSLHFGDEQDPGDVAADIQEVYDRGACELARQVTVHCAERGALLSKIFAVHSQLLDGMLAIDPQQRMTMQAVLAHPWLREEEAAPLPPKRARSAPPVGS